jgi:hypothetical protein
MEINISKMETPHQNPMTAFVSSCISMLSAFFAVITIQDVQPYFTLGASVIAILSGVFAVRYYYYATKKIKK